MATKKFLDAAGITHFAQLLNDYPNNELLGVVINAIDSAKQDQLIAGSHISIAQDNTISVVGVQTTNNLVTALSASSTNTEYPSAKAVYDAIEAAIANIANGNGVSY